MRTIRKGNDINVKWYITRHGEAEDFTNKDVKVYLYDKFNNKQEFTYTINGNVVDGYFLGKDQTTNGVYRLCLVENEGKNDMVTLDFIDCWLLSNKLKSQTASGSDSNLGIIKTETVEMSSVINTSGEVVDLTGYVTVDDVYTKEEVDQKIVDIATGGDIDLGVYAKKADVYTKDEVDSAISNVETIKGDKGDPFTYDDFTAEQLASLKGEKGDKGDTGAKGSKGDKGDKGDPFTYEDFTQAQLAALKGEKGDQGIQGPKGDKGEDGVVDTTNFYTKEQVDQKIIDAATEGVDLTDYALKNDVYTKSQVNTLIENVEGQVGDAGKSAYEIAVDNGYSGTEVEWLASLKGTDGDDGVKGEKGDKGDPFTYEDFTQAQLEALKGEKGDKGDAFTYSDFTSEQLAALKGEKGDKGDKGDTGSVDTTNFYTKAQVDQKVADAVSGGEIDLSGYAKTSDVYTKDEIDNFGYLTGADAKASIYSKDEIDAFGFLTEHQSLKDYAKKADYYSKSQIDEFAFLTGADAMATIYSKKEIDNMGFLTEHQSLADYFTKSEINTIKAGYYTKDEIDSFGYITAVDAADTIYTKTQIDNMGFLTSHQSLANYYTKGDVDTALEDYYTKTQVDNFGFLTSADAADTIYSKTEIDNKGFLTQHQSLANYYTKDDIDTTLEDYYTKDDIDGFAYLTSEDARQTIYSKTEIDNKGFLTEHQSLANYFTKSEIQEDYYDKEVIDNKFERVNAVPTKTSQLTNDSGFITSTDIAGKANSSDVYTKSQTYSKSEVDSLVSNSGGGSSSGGGFTVVTNPSDSTKIGLVNSLSEYYDTNIGKGAVIEGNGSSSNFKITATGDNSHAEGQYTRALGENSHAEGYGSQAYSFAHAEGNGTTATGTVSHAEGDSTQADGQYSHAEGYYTSASGKASHAEGNKTSVSGGYSHAEGDNTIASGQTSHAEGYYSTASGYYSHAEGSGTKATGYCSHTSGYETNADNIYEAAFGVRNVAKGSALDFGDKDKTLFTIGNGNVNGDRHNAFEVRTNGDVYIVDTSFLKEGNPNYNSSFTYHNVPSICLQDKLDTMLTSSNVSAVAVSGSYTDLRNRPFGDFLEQIGETIYTYEGTTSQNGPSHYGVSGVSIDTSNLSAGDEVILKVDDSVYGKGIVYTYSQGGFWINQDPANGSPFNDTWSVYSTNGTSYHICINNLGGTQHKIELVKDGGEQLVTRQIDSKYVDAYTKSEIDAKIAALQAQIDALLNT